MGGEVLFPQARGQCGGSRAGQTVRTRPADRGSDWPRRALTDKSLPCPMQRQYRLLLDVLDWNKSHARAAHRLADRLGIGGIVLVALHVRLDELRGHQAHGVALGL